MERTIAASPEDGTYVIADRISGIPGTLDI